MKPATVGTEVILSDLATLAQPKAVLATEPTNDRWLVLPYEGKAFSGTMLWSPSRSQGKPVEIPLPALGACRISVGIYGSVTWPWWFNLTGVYGLHTRWMRARVRLSDQAGFEDLLPQYDKTLPHLGHLSEVYFGSYELTGQSLIFEPPSLKPGYLDTCSLISHIRLEPVESIPAWPSETRTSVFYFDANLYGHYVKSADEVAGLLRPLARSDYGMLLWTTSREDSCYYPTKTGNLLPDLAMPGQYPYWAGSDLHTMLRSGQDPLEEVCRIGHDAGLKVFGSYRRMTRRMPPFVFPLHPEAMLEKHPECWCKDSQGKAVPHLSLTHAIVRQRVIDILAEQATHYDIDGVHLYFSRGLPLVFYEEAVLEEGRKRFGVDLRTLPVTDERLGASRAPFVTALFRELRLRLDDIGKRRGRRFAIAMHTPNTLDNCLYYGIDIAQLAKENLLDIHLPDRAHYMPDARGVKEISPASINAFVQAAAGTGTQVYPVIIGDKDMPATAKALYAAGAAGVHAGPQDISPSRWAFAEASRLGHRDELEDLAKYVKRDCRCLTIDSVAGLPFDHESGLPTCG